jgi:putative transcriptional regulator
MTKTVNIADELVVAMQQAVEHAQGKRKLRSHKLSHRYRASQIRKIRERLRLTQPEMAVMLGTTVSGFRKWEQGDREPRGAARMLLRLMEREPEAVVRALRSAA